MIAIPALPGWCLLAVGELHRAELEALFVACEDYVRLSEGRAPSSAQVDELLRELPPGRTHDDKHVLGVRDGAGQLVGAVDVVRDYPAKDEWFVGLELLVPSARGGGAGEHVYRALEEWVRQQGALSIWLAVLEVNPRARRFWERLGFRAVSERPVRLGALDHVAVRMTRRLDTSPASTAGT